MEKKAVILGTAANVAMAMAQEHAYTVGLDKEDPAKHNPWPADTRTIALDTSNAHIGFRARLDAAKAEGRSVVYLPHQASKELKRRLRQQILSGLRRLHKAPKIVREQDLLGGVDNLDTFRTADYATLVEMNKAIQKELAE